MKSGDKVVCIDATPLPNISPVDCELGEFRFPDGFIEEGAIYCVDEAFFQNGHLGLFLIGIRILFREEEVGWYSGRFRKIEGRHQTNSEEKVLKVG